MNISFATLLTVWLIVLGIAIGVGLATRTLKRAQPHRSRVFQLLFGFSGVLWVLVGLPLILLVVLIGLVALICAVPILTIVYLKNKLFPAPPPAPAPIELLEDPVPTSIKLLKDPIPVQQNSLEASEGTHEDRRDRLFDLSSDSDDLDQLLPYHTAAHWLDAKPTFKTIRLAMEREEDNKRRLRIRFLFLNSTLEEITLDDIHAIIYERQMRSAPPLLMTGSGGGELKLTIENSILKQEQQIYSLVSSDGCEYELVLDVTAICAAARILFGIVLDYCSITPAGSVTRKTITSDSLYLFRHGRVTTFPERDSAELHIKSDSDIFTAIDSVFINNLEKECLNNKAYLKFVRDLKSILERHLSYRPV